MRSEAECSSPVFTAAREAERIASVVTVHTNGSNELEETRRIRRQPNNPNPTVVWTGKRIAKGRHKAERTKKGRRQPTFFLFVKISPPVQCFCLTCEGLFGLALKPAGLAGSGAAAPKATPKRQRRRFVIAARRSMRRQPVAHARVPARLQGARIPASRRVEPA